MSKPHLNVVEFPHTALTDIPAHLRRIADEIEGGEEDADTVYVVIPQDGLPKIIGLGRVDDAQNHPMVQLGLALHKLYSMVSG